MSKLGSKFNMNGIKAFLGVEDIEDDIEFKDGTERTLEEKPKKDILSKSEKNNTIEQFDLGSQRKSQKEEVEDDKMNEYQSIFIDPKDFSDCKKIAKFIKSDRMVTINFEYLEPKKAQRMMDFLMGAMNISGASFIEISKKVYTSVPKSIKVYHEGKKAVSGSTYSMEQK